MDRHLISIDLFEQFGTPLHERLLRHVQYFTGVSPVTMNIDFERAAMNACETISLVKRSMLFFHLCQNVFRKVKENCLQALYEDLDPFRIHVKMIFSLAFVPPRDVGSAFGLLCLQFGGVGMNEQVILEYFERT